MKKKKNAKEKKRAEENKKKNPKKKKEEKKEKQKIHMHRDWPKLRMYSGKFYKSFSQTNEHAGSSGKSWKPKNNNDVCGNNGSLGEDIFFNAKV